MLHIVVLICVALGVRLFFLYQFPTPATSPDSTSFSYRAVEMVKQKSLLSLVDTVRMPIYPVFLSLFFHIAPLDKQSVEQLLMGVIGNQIVITQTIIGIVSVIIMYSFLTNITSANMAFITSAVYAGNMVLIPWERYVLSETLLYLMMILLTIQWHQLTAHPTYKQWFIWTVLYSIALFLKSIVIVLLPLLLLPFLFHKKKQLLMLLLGFYLWIGGLIGLYTYGNTIKYNVSQFQIISDVNIFGRLIAFYPPPKIPKHLHDIVSDFKTYGHPLQPYTLLHFAGGEFYYNQDLINQVKAYNHNAIKERPLTYFIDALKDLPKALVGISWDTKLFFHTHPILSIGQHVYTWLHVIMMLIGIATTPYVFLKKKVSRNILMWCIGTIVAVLLTTVLVSYDEYPRLFSPAIPLLYIMTSLNVHHLWKKIRETAQEIP